MYNHARTLLMNLTGEDRIYTDQPGDELIPASFKQLKLPRYLNTLRTKIFGALPDRFMLNYRTTQLLKTVQATRLRDYITALDPRITYDIYADKFYDKSVFEPSVMPFHANQTAVLSILGTADRPDAHGQCGYIYQLFYLPENVDFDYLLTEEGDLYLDEAGEPILLESIQSAYLTIRRLTPPAVTTTPLINVVSGTSNVIELPYSKYKVRLDTEQANIGWTVSGFLQPQSSLLDLYTQLLSTGEEDLLQLFGVVKEEPFLTFYNCWKDHPDLAYKLSGLVLAIIYRTEALRNDQQ